MCFGGTPSNNNQKPVQQPKRPALEPEFNSAQDRTRALLAAESGSSAASPRLVSSR